MSAKNGIDGRNLDAFNRALKEYTKYNQRDLGEIVENRANRMRWRLWRLFKEISPDKAKLNAELDALGWRIKRKPGVSLEREKRRRRSSLKYLSVSFLLKEWRIKKEGQNTKRSQWNRTHRHIGHVIDRTARGIRRPSVQITSFLEGALKMNIERGLVNKALAAETADMRRYIIRKQQQAQRRTVAKLNAFTKGISV